MFVRSVLENSTISVLEYARDVVGGVRPARLKIYYHRTMIVGTYSRVQYYTVYVHCMKTQLIVAQSGPVALIVYSKSNRR